MAGIDTITCKLTGDVGPGVKAHILPKSLYQLEKQPGLIISIADGKEKETQAGLWDNRIVIRKGEDLFFDPDDFAARFFLNTRGENSKKPAELIHHEGIPFALRVKESRQNLDLMKRFALCLLWRASVTSHSFFEEINLGPDDEENVRKMILARNPGSPHDYSVFLARYDDTPEFGLPIVKPGPDEMEGARVYKFPFTQGILTIRVGGAVPPPEMMYFAVGASDELRIAMAGPFKETPQYRALLKHAEQRWTQK